MPIAPGQKTATTIDANARIEVDNGGAVVTNMAPSIMNSFQLAFTTASMTNSQSITLSQVFTALVYTQTSTGNTVNLKAAPVNGETQGFSVTNVVTNLTVSSAANTVVDGAIATTVAGNTFWYIFNSADTSWYRYNGR